MQTIRLYIFVLVCLSILGLSFYHDDIIALTQAPTLIPSPMLTISTSRHLEQITPTQTPAPASAPITMDVICRMYHDGMFEIMRFMLSYLIFFPYKELNSKLILVFDDETELDHVVGAVLETAYKPLGVQVFYEKPPQERIFSTKMRNEGFSRTMWSNFYSDLYSDAQYVGMVDSDTEMSFRPTVGDHMIVNGSMPVIHGITQCCQFYDSTKYMVGKETMANFMFTFPFIVNRTHLAPMRQHIAQTTGSVSFEEAWRKMQDVYGDWSQFVIMGNYLYYFQHDYYQWDIAVDHTLSNVQYPRPVLGKNLPMNYDVEYTARKYHDSMCVQSANAASECREVRVGDTNNAMFSAFTDFWPHAICKSFSCDAVAAKTHDTAAPVQYTDAFNQLMKETSDQGGDSFWNDSHYNREQRTVDPVSLK